MFLVVLLTFLSLGGQNTFEAAERYSSSSYHHVYYRDFWSGNNRYAMTSAWFYADYAYVEVNAGGGHYTYGGWSGYNQDRTTYSDTVSQGTFSSHWHYYQ